MPNKITRQAEGTFFTPEEVAILKSKGQEIDSDFELNPMQVRMGQRLEFEVLVAGAKGGGKSFGGIFWMVRGNPDLPDFDANGKEIPHNRTYTCHPHFLGAVIRLNEKDLAEWVDLARPYYEGLLGGRYTKNPSEFRWPSGARIFLGHAQDSNAWTKYQGQNIVRFLVEEAGQIPDLDTFDLIRSCCRSMYPEMRAQMLLTANPGGPGTGWIFDRYIEPKDRDNKPILHPATGKAWTDADGGLIPIKEKATNPFTNEEIFTDRVWVPSYITDNPKALNNKSYIAVLATMRNEKQRRAYLFGDWKAFRGGYFDNFQLDVHTYDPRIRPLLGWWKATGFLDWGFVHKSAAYWHKRDPETNQQLIYREFTTTRTDPVALGAELARLSKPELNAQGSVTFYVSHDLFHNRTGEFTWVEMIQKGAQKVLGSGTCYVPQVIIDDVKERYRIEGKEWSDDIADRILSKPVEGIVFLRAPKNRAVGFMHMRTLMRTENLIPDIEAPIDWNLATALLQEGRDTDYVAYLKSFRRDREVLPELLISRDCPELIAAIPKAKHSEETPEDIDDKHFDGMDSLDSVRHGLAGLRDEKPSAMPKRLEQQRMVEQAKLRNPALDTRDLIWMMRHQAEQEDDGAQDGFVMRRGGRGRLQ